MTFRISIHTTGGPLDLDVKDGTLASDVIRQVLRQQDSDLGIESKNGNRRDERGFYLRARRTVEEGRWWSEEDIKAYRDRMSTLCCFLK